MGRSLFFAPERENAPHICTEHLMFRFKLHRAGNLAGAEAAGAHMNVCRGAIHDRLHALDVGLPGTIGTTVRVGNLDPEGDALTAEITFGHDINLLTGQNYISKDIVKNISRKKEKNQA